MLKLNASYSKKVPAEGEYSSQSYHASIEVELPDGLTQDQLQGKIHETFELVRSSVESELHGSDAGSVNNRPNGGANGNANGGANGKADPPASAKQLQYLADMARTRQVNILQIAARFNVRDIRALTRSQCSKLIDELNGKAA
jgi:hypothetical protein